MSFYVYLIHNIINNKFYVGKAKNPHKRWDKHIKVARGNREKEKFYIHRAISKYGIDNFSFSIIQTIFNENEANMAEIYWINFYLSNNSKYGYNQTNGGEGVSGRVVSKATRQKQREKAVGRKHNEETLKFMSGNNSHRSKLNFDQVNEIRYCFNYLKQSLQFLSKKYKVSSRTIARSVYNQDWYDEKYIPSTPRKINSNGKPKLTKEKAIQIRQMYSDNISIYEISKLFNVTIQNIAAIINNKIWRVK